LKTIYDRLLMIIENEDISIAAFERNIGVGRNSISSAIRNQSSIGHEVLSKICKHYPQYNIDRKWKRFALYQGYRNVGENEKTPQDLGVQSNIIIP